MSGTVTEYLAKEGLDHGKVGSWPAWHLVPYVSIWAVESLLAPGHVGCHEALRKRQASGQTQQSS
ncbi:DUF4826 family protein [Tunturiibacter gelidoferens]|uniref:DUF4826 family protein n=1 Tax=Tunturiibacter gelidiferens TaxID=3069689 RepID=UPI003342C76E